jgi:AmmeMemoRadiSam system protein A
MLNEMPPNISVDLQQQLLQVAKDSIQHGFKHRRAAKTDSTQYHPELQQILSCFVTLNRHHQLRGCIGHLTASQALVLDVIENAFSAAFKDPRFLPLKPTEFPDITIEISVLGKAYQIEVNSEADLIQTLRPEIDGLILKSTGQQATF